MVLRNASALPLVIACLMLVILHSRETFGLAWQPQRPESRRDLLKKITLGGLVGGILTPQLVFAMDDLFRPNPLTNKVLEQIRIWEQAEADNLKYGGELEGGDTGKRGSTSAYAQLLVPVLAIAAELESIDRSLRSGGRGQMLEAQLILDQPKYAKVNFKKIFNAYGDNIYYTDPDRANLYLGGGATPKSEQTLAYLLRNEILTNVEDLRSEVDFLLKNPEEAMDDMLNISSLAVAAMRKYLNVVPPDELVAARELLKVQST
jgi:hypothetical protein